MSGPVGCSSSNAAARVGPVTSTSSWMGTPLSSTVTKPGVSDLLPLLVKLRRPEQDTEVLPQPRRPADVDAGRTSFVAPLAFGPRLVPPLVDPARVRVLRRPPAPRVEELDLVAALEVDARVGPLRHQKVQLQLEVAVLPFGKEVAPVVLARLVDEDARAGRRPQVALRRPIRRHAPGDAPVGGRIAEGVEAVERDLVEREGRRLLLPERGPDGEGGEDEEEARGAPGTA